MGALCLLLLCGCGGGNGARLTGGDPLEFNVAGLTLRASSGGSVAGAAGATTLVLSDQPDTCLAIVYTPAGTATMLTLKVAPQADGNRSANVLPRKPDPAAGEAVGGLARTAAGRQTGVIDAVDGTVSWTVDASGNVGIAALDIGFSGTADRIAASNLFLQRCR